MSAPGDPDSPACNPPEALDASAAYHLWDELFTYGLTMALSTSSGTPEEQEIAWQNLLRSHSRSLRERDEMWARIAAHYR